MPYGDVEALLVDWLKTELDTENVADELPYNLTFVLPLTVVERYGGADRVITLDEPTIDIDSFDATLAGAKAGAERIRTLVRRKLPGRILGGPVGGTSVVWTKTISGPARRPWDNTDLRRVVGSYQLKLHTPLL